MGKKKKRKTETATRLTLFLKMEIKCEEKKMLSGRGDSHFAPDAFVRDGRRVELRRRRHDLLTLLRERGLRRLGVMHRRGPGGHARSRWVKKTLLLLWMSSCCCWLLQVVVVVVERLVGRGSPHCDGDPHLVTRHGWRGRRRPVIHHLSLIHCGMGRRRHRAPLHRETSSPRQDPRDRRVLGFADYSAFFERSITETT